MRKRRLHRRERKKRRNIIIFSMCLVFLGLSTSYAAFSTGIVMNAKGNVKQKEITVSELKNEAVTSDDGLYADYTEDGRYVYKGINPNNYIKLGDDMYRIIAVEKDNTLKVIRSKSIGSMIIDPGYSNSIAGVTEENSIIGTRYSSNKSDYCYFSDDFSNYFGCNVWGSKYTMLDASENNVTQMRKKTSGDPNLYNLPDKEAYLNTYLNDVWYEGLDNGVQSIIVNHIFYVGHVNISSNETLEENVKQEQFYKWRGKIGLVGIVDYVKGNSNTTECGNINDDCNNFQICKSTNWLKRLSYSISSHIWTITPSTIEVGNHYQWFINTTDEITKNQAYNSKYVHPVFFLSSNISLKGYGTESGPYVIVK